MIMKIYAVWELIMVILLFVKVIIEYKMEKRINVQCGKNLKIFEYIYRILIILFYIYNIYVLRINYCEISNFISVNCIILITFSIIVYVMKRSKIQILQDFGEIFAPIILVILLFFYLFASQWFFAPSEVQINSEQNREYAYSIKIEEFRFETYTKVKGERYYVESMPSCVYYYKMKNQNGNTITESIDGYKHYVEEDIDDKYQNNPHIDVYYEKVTYYNLYGKKETKTLGESYVICVPENSIKESK